MATLAKSKTAAHDTARDAARDALAAAIAERSVAQRNLDDARAAASKAAAAYDDVGGQIDRLRADLESALPSGAFISDLAGGGDFDVMTLSRPTAQAREKIEALEQKAAAWRHARDVAEQSIPVRQQALDAATRRVDVAARAVVASNINANDLIQQAEQAQAAVIAARIRLWELHALLPQGCAEHATIEKFLSAAWLSQEGNWRHHAAAAPLREMFEALLCDAGAPLAQGELMSCARSTS